MFSGYSSLLLFSGLSCEPLLCFPTLHFSAPTFSLQCGRRNWSMLWSHPCYYPCFFAFCVLKTEVLPFSPLSYTQISWKSLNALLKWGSSTGSQGDSHPPWASGRDWGTRLGGHLDHILLRGAIEVFLTEYHRKMFPKHRTTISRIMSTMSLNPHLSPSGVPSYFWVWMKV